MYYTTVMLFICDYLNSVKKTLKTQSTKVLDFNFKVTKVFLGCSEDCVKEKQSIDQLMNVQVISTVAEENLIF